MGEKSTRPSHDPLSEEEAAIRRRALLGTLPTSEGLKLKPDMEVPTEVQPNNEKPQGEGRWNKINEKGEIIRNERKDFSPQGEGQRPANYQKVFQEFQSRGLDHLVRLELLEMAEGGNPTGDNPDPEFKGIREEYYPGWKNEDFAALLADLGSPIREE